MFLWCKYIFLAEQSPKTAEKMQLAMQSRLQILSYFMQTPPTFDYTIRVFTLRLYTEMLAQNLLIPING